MSIVYLGADHRGFGLKEKIKAWLKEWEYGFREIGSKVYVKDDDYADVAIDVAKNVIIGKAKGILVCGSGVGVCIAANKVSGIRAALCTSEKQAYFARNDDDANILCLSADLVSEEDNKIIIKTFLETLFSSEEKHVRRIEKIKKYEST